MTARRRNEYFPIYFVGPKPKDPAIFGYDVASEPTRRDSIRLACETGKTVASGRIKFVHDESSSGGFLVCLPVFEKDKPAGTAADRRHNYLGCILGVFRPVDMIEAAVGPLQPAGIDIGLYDASNAAGGVFDIHASRARTDAGGRSRLADCSADRYAAPLGVPGRPWTIVCAATPEFEAAHRSWWPVGVLVAGLAFTAMLTGYCGRASTTRRTWKIRSASRPPTSAPPRRR